MPVGCPGRDSRMCSVRSPCRSKAISWRPSRGSRPPVTISSTSPVQASGSMVSGSWPARPSSTAVSEPWPTPVAASEPNSSACTRAVRSRTPCWPMLSVKRRAARMGPTVWDEDGPMPIENRSRTLSAMQCS